MVSIANTGQLAEKCQLKVKLVLPVLQPGEVVTWQEATGRSSIAVEPNGVDRGGNGSAAVAPPLLLRLLVSERLALGEPEGVVGLLAPVPAGSPLSAQQKNRQHVSQEFAFRKVSSLFIGVTTLTFASNELSARRGSTSTSSSFIRRNGTFVWKSHF